MYYSDPNYEYNVLVRLICTLWEKGVITEKEEKYIVTGNEEEQENEKE